MSGVLFIPWLLPILALLIGWSSLRVLTRAALWTPVLAVGVVLIWLKERFEVLDLHWLFLGSQIGLDEQGAALLFGVAMVWLAGALLAVRHLRARTLSVRFFRFWLLALSGSLGAILALDPASFYLFYAVMGLSAWGLIDYHRNTGSRLVGLIYLLIAFLGEVLILVGLLFVATGLEPLPSFAWIALLIGFGLKVGLVGLHGILPLIYHAATPPAAVVLAGAMATIGFLGWLRFLPLGLHAEPFWGSVWMIAGGAAVLIGLLLGLTQRHARAILGYSSIMQYGMLTFVVGTILAKPALWPTLAPLITLYLIGHGWVKALLMLCSEYLQKQGQRLYQIGGISLAAVLAGVPLTGGAGAKGLLKTPLAQSDLSAALFFLLAFGSTLLMVRFFSTIRAQRHPGPIVSSRGVLEGLFWGLLIALVLPWVSLGAALKIEGLYPVMAALLLAWLWRRTRGGLLLAFAPGDLTHALMRQLQRLGHRLKKRKQKPPPASIQRALPTLHGERVEAWFREGMIWVALFWLVVFAIALGG